MKEVPLTFVSEYMLACIPVSEHLGVQNYAILVL